MDDSQSPQRCVLFRTCIFAADRSKLSGITTMCRRFQRDCVLVRMSCLRSEHGIKMNRTSQILKKDTFNTVENSALMALERHARLYRSRLKRSSGCLVTLLPAIHAMNRPNVSGLSVGHWKTLWAGWNGRSRQRSQKRPL